MRDTQSASTGHRHIRHALFSGIALVILTATANTQTAVQGPPWPAGDERGMANTLGTATWQRCAPHLSNPKSKSYEVSHLRSNTMPQSPFGTPLVDKYRPTIGIPGTRHAFNGEEAVSGEAGAQGTQMDALGHFAVLPEPWDGKGDFPSGRASYYGGYHATTSEAVGGLAVAEAWHRQGAADCHDRDPAGRQVASRWRQADGAGRAGHRQ